MKILRVSICVLLCALFISCGKEKLLDQPVNQNIIYDRDNGGADQFYDSDTALTAFNFPEPGKDELSKKLSLWATYYYTPTYEYSTEKKHSLIDLKGKRLGPTLSNKQWCMAALEGSVNIKYNNDNIVYNFAGYGSYMQVNCSPYFRYTKSGRVRFKRARGPYGDGAGKKGYILFPYRTVAVDSSKIPLGTVLYIPKARGIKINISGKRTLIHDGYFFAADVGGAIKSNHIDVFMGFKYIGAFRSFVKSSRRGLFDAYIVENSEIRDMFEAAHLTKSTTLEGDEFGDCLEKQHFLTIFE